MRRRVLGLILAATLLAVTLLGAGTYIYVRKLMLERTEERMEDIARLLLNELEPGEEAEQAKLSKQIGIHWDDSELNRVISTINTEFMADGTFLLSGTGIDYEEELKELEKEMEALGLSMVTERMNQIFRKETGV